MEQQENTSRTQGTEVKTWYQQEFLPWKIQMQRLRATQANQITLLRNQKQQVQYLVGLVLNGKYQEAVKGWNALGLQPELTALALDSATETLTFTITGGKVLTLPLSQLLADLEEIITGNAPSTAKPAAE